MAILALAWLPVAGQSSGYLGPQILSRGGSVGSRPGDYVGFSFYAGVYGTYETGIVPTSVDSQGHIIDQQSLVGVGLDIGAYGRKTWRHTTVGLDYRGDFRHYVGNPYYDGSDHAVALAVATQTSRRLQFHGVVDAGTMSRYYVEGPASSTELLSTPNYGIFDDRTYFLETNVGLTYQANARLSYSASGVGFFVRRQNTALIGLNGYGAQGEVAYRLSRTRTIFGTYGYTHYDYPHGFGESDIQTYMLGIGQALGRRWVASVSAGASQISTIGLEQVAVDPITAALFGIPISTQAFSRTVVIAAGRADLSGKFKHSTVNIFYSQMPSPGNGVYLTSKSSDMGGSYSYLGIRRTALSASVMYTRLSSIGQQQLGTYSHAGAGASCSYKILGSLEASANYDLRNVQIDQTNGFSRLSYSVRFGLNFHPGELPISLW